MLESGGSEPGLYNACAAQRRAPWFSGTNPCGEILLPNQGFCNLCEVNLASFTSSEESCHALRIISRANYRQTVVNLEDGILSPGWHQTNEALRLCGVGLTGISQCTQDFNRKEMRQVAKNAAYGMADELGLERPKAVTTIKPSGTMSKLMGTTPGIHDPVGRYVLYNINFSIHSEMTEKLVAAGYRTQVNPYDPESVLISLPEDYGEGVPETPLSAIE